MPGVSVGQAAVRKRFLAGALALALAACARQADTVVNHAAPGFFAGLWHGYIVLFSFVGSLFSPEVAIYAVPNNGGWYNFGFALGVGAFTGGGAAASRR